jgi:hypothetical protein
MSSFFKNLYYINKYDKTLIIMENSNNTKTRKRRSRKTSNLENTYNEIYNTLNNKSKPLGTLYNSINYSTTEDFDNFIDNLTDSQALFCLIEASKMAHNRNIFTIEESELLSKSIRMLKKNNEDLNIN